MEKSKIKTIGEAITHTARLKSTVAKHNAIRWFIKNKGWYL